MFSIVPFVADIINAALVNRIFPISASYTSVTFGSHLNHFQPAREWRQLDRLDAHPVTVFGKH